MSNLKLFIIIVASWTLTLETLMKLKSNKRKTTIIFEQLSLLCNFCFKTLSKIVIFSYAE